MRYLDANIFIRYLTQDHPVMSPAALGLFERIENGIETARVLESTIAEVVYVLTSPNLYGVTRSDVRERLLPVLLLGGLLLQNKGSCLRAMELYVRTPAINFADAMIAVAALDEAPHEIYSYDRGFDRVEGVTRVEP